MTKTELIMTIAKDLLLRQMEVHHDSLKLSLRGGDETVKDLGARFRVMVKEVEATLDSIANP